MTSLTSQGRVAGKVAFITGAARGQGRSHALRLAVEGAAVVAVDSCAVIDTIDYDLPTVDDLEETARLVRDAGGRVVTVVADVRDQSQLDDAVAQGIAEFGFIDVVCANAGVISFESTWKLSEEQWTTVVDTNLNGAWRTIKAVVPGMIEEARGGSIIITSSVQGLKGSANVAHYSSSKAGVMALMRSLANEVGMYGIRVNSVNPGSVATPMLLNHATYRVFGPDVENPDQNMLRERTAARNALDLPWAEPEDLSNAVLWLASEESRCVTGVSIPVDCGQLLT